MPREVDPYDHDVAMRALRRIVSAGSHAEAASIARAALDIIEPPRPPEAKLGTFSIANQNAPEQLP